MERLIALLLKLVAFVLTSSGSVLVFVLSNAIEALQIVVLAIDGLLRLAVIVLVVWVIVHLLSLG
jgi:hypothetical protein